MQKVSSISSSNDSTADNVVSNNSRKKILLFVKRIISVLCTLAIFAGGLWYANGLLINKRSHQQYKPYYDSDKNFDVLFFGSSHPRDGISPIDIFHDFGITSYNLSMAGNHIKECYYMVVEIIEMRKKQNGDVPHTILFDIYDLRGGLADRHNAWDFFPYSPNKKTMIQNTVPKENQAEFYFPFSLYHKRWIEIAKNDFDTNLNLLKGVLLRYGCVLPAKKVISDRNDKKELNEEKIKYLDMLLEYCDENFINLILINIPYIYNLNEQREANAVYDYATSRNLQYINYANEAIGLDYDVDFFDQGHLNPVGMRKLTNEIGKLLVANGVPDHRAEPEIAEKWNADYEYYVSYKRDRFGELNQAKVYLMALNDRDFYGDVYVNSEMLDDVQIAKLVDNLKAIGHNVEIGNGRKQVKVGNNTKNYDIYCQTFMANEREKPFHRAGFVYSESWAKQ